MKKIIALSSFIALSVVPIVANAQVCTQPITLRSGVCPVGSTTCTSKGASLLWSDLDNDIINIANICNAIPTSFVSTVAAGTGIAVTGTTTSTVSLKYTDTLASNSLTAGQCEFISSGTGGVLCEGSSVDAFEHFLTFVDPTADRTITFPNVTGTVITTGDSATVSNTMLASSYSGVGACGANLWASTLNTNSAPSCTQINYTNLAGSLPATISSSASSSIVTVTPATGITLTEDEAATTGSSIIRLKSRGGASASVNDIAGQDLYQFRNSANSAVNGAIVDITATNVTSTAETADYRFRVRVAGALSTMMTLFGTTNTVSIPEPITIYQPTIGVAGTAKSSHIITAGTSPTISCTGTGTGGTSSLAGTDAAFVITLSTGTAPASTGTCTVTFNSAYVTNFPVCIIGLTSGAASWGSTASVSITTESLTAMQVTWDNSTAGLLGALTASSSYKLSGICIQK